MQRLLFIFIACCLYGTTTLSAQLWVPDTVHFGDCVLPTYKTSVKYDAVIPFINTGKDTIYLTNTKILQYSTPAFPEQGFNLREVPSSPFTNERIILPGDTIFMTHSYFISDPTKMKDTIANLS